MTLIKSISGIRGTIGSHPGEALTPIDIVRFTAAFAEFIDKTTTRNNRLMVVGRDARISGGMVCDIVVGTLMAMGFDVVNIGLASTPTTEMAVVGEEACGGLILTASHNPAQWNALKMLNEHGEFLNAEEGARVLEIADSKDYTFAPVDKLGREYIIPLRQLHSTEFDPLGLRHTAAAGLSACRLSGKPDREVAIWLHIRDG